jgi:hypothetical protein
MSSLRLLRARTFSFNRASLTGFDLGAGKGGADTFSSGMVSAAMDDIRTHTGKK